MRSSNASLRADHFSQLPMIGAKGFDWERGEVGWRPSLPMRFDRTKKTASAHFVPDRSLTCPAQKLHPIFLAILPGQILASGAR